MASPGRYYAAFRANANSHMRVRPWHGCGAGHGRPALPAIAGPRSLMADNVAKVENRTTPKISQKLIFSQCHGNTL
jgi:hypothetical protein